MYAVAGVLGTLVLGNVLKRSIVLAPEKTSSSLLYLFLINQPLKGDGK